MGGAGSTRPGAERAHEGWLLAIAALLFVVARGPAPPAGAFEPGPRPAGGLRVVTWNVGGSGGRGGRRLADEHLDAVAETLAALDPDLALLQEVRDAEQLARLRGRLGPSWVASAERRGVCALARRGSLERLEAVDGDLPGRALAVRYAPHRGAPVVALALHAHPWSSRRRNAEIGAAAEALLARPEARLLAGDLNLDLDLDKRRDLFTDDEHRDVETYNWLAERLADAAQGRGATAEPDRRLDYVFVQPERFRVRAAGPWPGRRAGDMDHDPVVADLERRP